MKIRISLIGWYLILFAFVAVSLICLTGCKQIQYVPVETVRTEYVSRTDTIHKTDTVTNNKETVIREVNEGDSVLLAQYGIRLKDNERMLLFLQRELEREKSQQKESVHDTVIKTDSVQVPYPVPAELSRWQKFCCDYGKIMLGVSAALAILLVIILLYWIRYRRNQRRE